MLTADGRSLVDHRAGPASRIRQNDYEFHLHFQLIDADLPENDAIISGQTGLQTVQSSSTYSVRSRENLSYSTRCSIRSQLSDSSGHSRTSVWLIEASPSKLVLSLACHQNLNVYSSVLDRGLGHRRLPTRART